MQTLVHFLETELKRAFKKAFELEREMEIVPCESEQFGHYQCNSALKFSKELKKNPREISQKIIEHLSPQLRSQCSKIEIAGPGFINFTFSAPFLSEQMQAQIQDRLLGVPIPQKKQKIVIDFSSPNIAKELHVGHLRSTIIGDSIARLFEFLGHDVLRLNHVGDWGTQFGMLIAYMKKWAPGVIAGEKTTDLDSLMNWYRLAKKSFDEDPIFQKTAKEEVLKLQSGDPLSRKIWNLICDISRKGFQEIYDLLHIEIIERGESFYNPALQNVVHELDQKGLVTVSDGAKCIFLDQFKNREGEPFPLIIQKTDGGFNYDTTDMAAIRHRIFEEKADRIIYVTDNGQSLHFQLIFAAAEKAGWLKPEKPRVDHVGFGLVLGADGKKFKTRSGDTEKLIDLLTESIDRAKVVLQEKRENVAEKELDHLANVIGIDAVKYADLSTHRTKDYTFSYDRMLRFEGNTAVFLLYSYVRINGIKRKTKSDIQQILATSHVHITHPSEISLALHLRRFGEIIERISFDLLPNHLAEYLYILAEKFNAFFRDCRVEGSEEENSRLIVCELTACVLKQGLEILGLEVVDRM